jgi:hypothetical protein
MMCGAPVLSGPPAIARRLPAERLSISSSAGLLEEGPRPVPPRWNPKPALGADAVPPTLLARADGDRIACQFPGLAQSGPSAMSAIRSLSGAKRTPSSDCRTTAIYESTPLSTPGSRAVNDMDGSRREPSIVSAICINMCTHRLSNLHKHMYG